MLSKSFAALAALSTAVIAQDTSGLTFSSLYIPGFDPQPINVQAVGAGSDGRTTYVLGPGVATNTDDTPLPVTGTLVEGPNDAVETFIASIGDGGSLATFVESCTISAGSAHCLVGDGTSFTETDDEAATPIVVQIAATPAPTPSGGSSSVSSGGGGSLSASGGSSPASTQQTPSQTGASQTPSPSAGNNSGAMALTITSPAFVLSAIGIVLALL